MPIKKIKISELPASQSLRDLHTIGVDDSNQSVKVALTPLQNAIDEWITTKQKVENLERTTSAMYENELSYGVEWSETEVNTKCRRVGNADLHRTLPIQNRMRGCLLNDSGTVNKYLPSHSWLGEDRSGTSGQVMVEIPAHYRKFSKEGNTCTVKISEHALPGFHAVPKKYISAYEASVQRSTQTLCSVANPTADFRGGENNAALDTTPRSQLGKPATKLTISQFRNFARKRGGGSQWNCLDYHTYKDVFWLAIIELADRNTTLAFSNAKDGNGFTTGGMGNGVRLYEWQLFNGMNPFVPCGYTDSAGNNSTENTYSITDGSQTWTVRANRYRGIEQPFGHIWKAIDGIFAEIITGGTVRVYGTNDPSKYHLCNGDTYDLMGNLPAQQGHIKNISFGEHGEIVPLEVGGGSSSHWCSYYYIGAAEVKRDIYAGGSASNGDGIGLCALNAYSEHNSAHQSVGTRLIFLPQ